MRFFCDILSFPSVDAGDGWLIFALPPSEVAVHQAEESGRHELYLMCDDAAKFVAEMAEKGVECAPAQNVGWGVLTRITLPGGGTVGVYEPRHARPRLTRSRVPLAIQRCHGSLSIGPLRSLGSRLSAEGIDRCIAILGQAYMHRR